MKYSPSRVCSSFLSKYFARCPFVTMIESIGRKKIRQPTTEKHKNEEEKKNPIFRLFCVSEEKEKEKGSGKRKRKRKKTLFEEIQRRRKMMASAPPRKEEEEERNSFPRQFDEERSSKEMNFKIDEGNGVVQAIFPLGPTPLTFFPPFTFEKKYLSWTFKMTGNYFWICGIVPYKQTKMGMIHCLNRSKIALFTPGYARFQPFGTVSNLLHGNQIRVDVDGEKKKILIQIGEIESVPFDFEGPEWEDGFFFCVGGCRGAVLTLKEEQMAVIKPAKRN